MRAQNEKLYAVLLEQMKEADLRRMMNTKQHPDGGQRAGAEGFDRPARLRQR